MRRFLVAGAALVVAMWSPAAAAGFGGSSEHGTTTSQTTTTTTNNGDSTTTTTTTRSESSSHGGGWNWGSGGPSRHDSYSYESLGGSWIIGETEGNKTCELTLEKTKFISSYSAHTGIGCPEGLFSVASWILAGDEIRLMSPAGSLLAKLHPAGHGRWDGRTTAGLEIFMTRH
jgi:hypothetical protein